MCGICGFIDGSRGQAGSEDLIGKMVSHLRHRGPDSSGYWVDPDSGVALGHSRLAILDLSEAGHQPMHSSSGRYVISYNGEIYNFRDLRGNLERGGIPKATFRGHSDTEVILESIETCGMDEALRRFNGMFAFAILDRKMRRLTLARDRMGEKPLYYGRAGKAFFFASELKALRVFSDFEFKVNRDVLPLYLRYGYVPSPWSIYKDIFKLPPGMALTIDIDQDELPEPYAYWSLNEVAGKGVSDRYDGSVDDATNDLDLLLRDAVKIRMESDVPLGAFLSGGIDSSLIVAMMQRETERKVKTFTIGFKDSRFNEADFAKSVAGYLQTEHTELYLSPEETRSIIPDLPTIFDEPFADPSGIPTFLVSRLAREDVTVCLSGDGGDEIFGGYRRYLGSIRDWERIRRLPKPVREPVSKMLLMMPEECWDAVFNVTRRMMPAAARWMCGSKVHELAWFLSQENLCSLYGYRNSIWKNGDDMVCNGQGSLDLYGGRVRAVPEHSEDLESLMYMDTLRYLPDDILVKVDRSSMAVSLEARVPILDHRIVEFSWKLPVSMKSCRGKGKWILRRLLERYVPQELFDRPKHGFGVPIDEWLRNDLRDWAEDLLNESRLRAEGFFDASAVRNRWREHLEGKRNRHFQLWAVLMFEAWLRSPVCMALHEPLRA